MNKFKVGDRVCRVYDQNDTYTITQPVFDKNGDINKYYLKVDAYGGHECLYDIDSEISGGGGLVFIDNYDDFLDKIRDRLE